MATVSAPSIAALQNLVLDYQPTPIITLSSTNTILLANRACRTLFSQSDELVGKHLSYLPLSWQDPSGATRTLTDFIANSNNGKQHVSGDTQSESPAKIELQVHICTDSNSAVVSTSLIITNCSIHGHQFQILAFENVKQDCSHIKVADELPREQSCTSAAQTRFQYAGRTYNGIRNPATMNEQDLEAKFSQLRDALYFNERERSGFLMSADETFCFPNYEGLGNVAPVEIENLEQFYQNWDVWDPDFTNPMPISEYPAIHISRVRKPLEKRRYGLKEDGKRYILEISGKPLYDHHSGQYVGLVVWVSRLGEYETVVANDLKANLADFRTMCDRLPHILWSVDPDGHADYFSKSWYEFTGLSEEQSLGLGFQQAINEEDLQKLWAAFEVSIKAKSECLSEARYRRHDGKWVWMSARAKPLFDAQGNILKWYGSSTSIDSLMVERLIAERQRAQMMGMLSLADVGLFEVDSEWHLTTLEGRMLWQDELQLNQVSLQVDQPGVVNAPTFKRHLQEVMMGQREAAVFEELIGARWYKFRLVVGSESNKDTLAKVQKKVLGCSVDITEQRMHTALESENARLIHEASLETEKSRLKTAFLAHMSHEIRTPIAGIIGTANMLAEASLDDQVRDGINDIEVLGNNLLTIINDILDFSKIEAGKMDFESTSYDMNAVIGQVKKVFGHVLRGKPTQIVTKQDLSMPFPMLGDPGRAKQILTNLVSNAVKFTHKGIIELQVCAVDNKVQVSVRDTGEGIDKQTMSTLFKPFVQGDASTARRHGGTGLGLTISRDLADKMGGSLILTSVVSEGTLATLTLPRGSKITELSLDKLDSAKMQTEVVVRELVAPKLAGQPPAPSDLLVLVVEDNAVNQKVALNLVRKLGYRAEAVWNGQEALDYVETKGTPSLILMDCQMPLMDGLEATRRLRGDAKYQESRSVPIIALTASAVQGDREKCYAAGMDAYLCKPVTKKSLQAMLDKFSIGVN